MQELADPKGYYRLLGVTRQASPDDIKRAYRLRIKKLHPDRNRHKHADAAFIAVQQAYQVLADPARRQEYDEIQVTNHLAAADPPSGRSAVDRFIRNRTRTPWPRAPDLAKRYRLALLILGLVGGITGLWLFALQWLLQDSVSRPNVSVAIPENPALTSAFTFQSADSQSLAYIKVTSASVQLHPNYASAVVDRLRRYDGLRIIGHVDGGFVDVVTPREIRGFVHQAQVERGSGWLERRRSCLNEGTAQNPASMILQKRRTGVAEIAIINALPAAVLIKLKDSRDITHLSSYIPAGQAQTIEQVPMGDYRIYAATGRRLVPACALFLDDMKSVRLNQSLNIDFNQNQWPDLVLTPGVLSEATNVVNDVFLID